MKDARVLEIDWGSWDACILAYCPVMLGFCAFLSVLGQHREGHEGRHGVE